MKAALLYGPGDLRITNLDKPSPAPEEVVVQVICYSPYGTDLGAYLNQDRRYIKSYPVGIGADFSGVISSVGKKVAGFVAGDRVSALAMAHCGLCRNCLAGRTNLCLDESFLNSPRQVACQEYTTVMARKLARLPDVVTFEDAAMLGGIVDALNAFDMTKPKEGETIAIIGVGAMGWAAIATAKTFGNTVVAVGGTGKRVELAESAGADYVVPLDSYDEDVTKKVLAVVPNGLDCVMETSATNWGVKQSFSIAAVGGRIALTGAPAPLTVTPWQMVHKELAVFGVRAGHHQERALELIAQGRINLKPTITHRMGLTQAPEIFALLTGSDAKNTGRIIVQIGNDLS